MIGDKLRELHEEKGCTQADLADAVCVSKKSVTNWESDISDPDLFHLIGIADYYDITLDELVGRKLGECIHIGKMCETNRQLLRGIVNVFKTNSDESSE